MLNKPLLGFVVCLLLGCTSDNPHSTTDVHLIKTHPYNQDFFTQGLTYLSDDEVLVSTGLYGHSKLLIYNYKNETTKPLFSLPASEFGEGSTITPAGTWLLTWKDGKAYHLVNNGRSLLGVSNYGTEGWGLTYHPKKNVLVMSDGSHHLQFRNPATFAIQKIIQVKDSTGVSIRHLNELEYANNHIYANVWQTSDILKINPDTGRVVKIYDTQPLLDSLPISQKERERMDVLNGIAHIEKDRFLLSGKFYPVLLEVVLK